MRKDGPNIAEKGRLPPYGTLPTFSDVANHAANECVYY